jgi:hypothetical protein
MTIAFGRNYCLNQRDFLESTTLQYTEILQISFEKLLKKVGITYIF